jgi:hypothetical protein
MPPDVLSAMGLGTPAFDIVDVANLSIPTLMPFLSFCFTLNQLAREPLSPDLGATFRRHPLARPRYFQR